MFDMILILVSLELCGCNLGSFQDSWWLKKQENFTGQSSVCENAQVNY